MQTKVEKGLFNALKQKADKLGISESIVTKTVGQVLQLSERVDLSKQMMQRIGICLIKDGGHILAPACPDYTHSNGVYTFKGINGGVSLLAQLHIKFLQQVTAIIPDCKVTILIADHEADDDALCQAISKDRVEFAKLIGQSVEKTSLAVKEFGWSAQAMTTVIPDLVAREEYNMKLIRSSPQFEARIRTDTAARMKMYRQINRNFTVPEMIERTIRTAAQYLAMGEVAVEKQIIICNHSTVNLCWYKEAGTAVLHNPVTVY